MEKHNFADWEITKLLPENKNTDCYWFMHDFDTEPSVIEEKHWDNRYNLLEWNRCKPAWTWEDIRLYLKEKGYIIGSIVITNNQYEDYYRFFIRNNKTKERIWLTAVEDYEKERKESIIYCLNLIKRD